MPVCVRFAPSPTGHLHVGSVRVAIFNWLFARHNEGKYLVRIEDTDIARSRKEYVNSITDSLEWLGLASDEKVFSQMERTEEHKKVALGLLEKGLAYPCFCKPNPTEPSNGVIGQKYPGTCRDKQYTKDDLTRAHALRFKLPDRKQISFVDMIRGKITVDMDQLDDFVIVRRDGTPTYNFVVVLDDIFMQITHVIRGEDHISNTPKQIFLYEALGKTTPAFAHLPLILGKSGERLSKRDAAVSVMEYKESGFLPNAFFNYLVRLGWSHGDQEIFSREELVKLFTLEKVGKKGAVFDIKKLAWLNGIYIRELELSEFLKAISQVDETLKERLESAWEEKLTSLFALYKDRAVSITDLANDMISFKDDPETLDIDLIAKWKSDKTHLLVQDYIERLEISETLDHDGLLVNAKSVCEEYGTKLVELAQAIRLALAGKVQSPPVFDMIVILGKNKTVLRLKNFLEALRASEPVVGLARKD